MIVTLLTDYGHEDEFVGVCHGVLRSIDARTPIVDITHGIPRHDVRRGALVLRNALPYMPLGVHVAIVDPEVGDGRRALALRCRDGRLLVGPDNGLLSLAWRSSGGIERALDVTRSRHRREPVSATFHGRDVFAPVAAALASGADLAGAGETVDPDTLVHLDLAPPRTEDGVLIAHTLLVDGFGNAALDATCEQLGGEPGAAVEVEAGDGRHRATRATTFARGGPGELLLYCDSNGMLALAINRGDAATTLGLRPGSEVRLRRR